MNRKRTNLDSAGKFTRRRWLQLGALGLTGLLLNDLPAADSQVSNISTGSTGNSFGRAKRCVMLFLTGGAPQHDTFDPKPLAPAWRPYRACEGSPVLGVLA